MFLVVKNTEQLLQHSKLYLSKSIYAIFRTQFAATVARHSCVTAHVS